jgi:predicted ATPase
VTPVHIRIFLSSPGDVAEERAIVTEQVMHFLAYDPFVRGRATVELVAWDAPSGGAPMPWGDTPQASVNTYLPLPSTCDIVVSALWARLGTPPPFPQFQTEAGEPFGSGTLWELEDAFRGARAAGRPDVLLYRRMNPVDLDPSAPDFAERTAQKQRVDELFDGFRDGQSGALLHGYKTYASLDQFRTNLISDLRSLVKRIIEDHERKGAAAQRHGNITLRPTSFVGRQREVDDLQRQLESASVVTVVGPGGSGKTRLAVEVGARMGDHLDGGAWFADLSNLTDPDGVAPTIAAAVGLRLQDQEPTDAVVSFVGDRPTLLVLDNCEHVVDTVANVIGALLDAGGLRVLATSQLPTGAVGEFVFRLDTLPLPDADGSLEAVMQSPAVQLFADRARAARRDFVLDARSAPDVARICAALDGLPLAIELAAARIGSLSTKQLFDRLGVALRTAAGAARGTPRRHATLDAALQWSYDLLTPGESALLSRFSVFVDGSTLEAAESVCRASDLPGEEVWAVLTSLADHSLVVFDDGERPRYRMLRVVRTFAGQRLADDDERRAADLHCDWFVELAERLQPELTGPNQQQAEDELESEMGNLRAAFDRAIGYPTADSALRLANAAWRFLEDRGNWRDWQRWFDQALSHPGGAAPDHLASGLLYGALIAERQGDMELCASRCEQALARFRQLDDEGGRAAALSLLGGSYMGSGQYQRAAAPIEEALAIRRRIGDQRGIAVSLSNLGKLRYEEGRFDDARELVAASLDAFRQVDDPAGVARQLTDIAEISLVLGAVDEAERFGTEGAAVAERIGNRQLRAWNGRILGRVAAARGHRDEADRLLRQAVVDLRDLGADRLVLSALGDIAMLSVEVDDRRAALLLSGVRELRASRGLPADAEEEQRFATAEAALGTVGTGAAEISVVPSLDRLVDIALGPSAEAPAHVR